MCHAARVIDLTRSLRHLAWADARLFEDLAALPPEALQARYAPEAWTVGNLAMHNVGGAEWSGTPTAWMASSGLISPSPRPPPTYARLRPA